VYRSRAISRSRVFTPSLGLTLLIVALCAAFVSLGRWQWHRGDLRQAQWQAFARGADRAVPLGSQSLAALPRFQRITATGRFDPQHQFLLDNITHGEAAGYEVLTPFQLTNGREVLVDRGWVPFTGYRDRLPDIAFESGDARPIIARVDELPVAGLALGKAAPQADASWPKLASYPDMPQLAAVLGRRLEPRILLLDPGAPDGYLREWQPPGLPPLRHWSYALQWWAFAVAAVVIWFVLSWRKAPKVS